MNWGDRSPARQREVLSGAELAVAHDPVRYQGPHRQPSTSKSPANAAAGASAPAEPGASFSESPVENNGVGQLRLNGYPRQPLCCLGPFTRSGGVPWGRDEPPARRAPAATLALMATEDSRTPRPRHTPTPTSARPRCDNPDCSHAAYVLAHDSHHYCPSCFHRRTAVWRRENRERGLCACGQAPTENYKTCHRCRNRSALRIRRWRLRQQYGPPTHGWYTVDANTASVTPSRAKKREGIEDALPTMCSTSSIAGKPRCLLGRLRMCS